MLETSIHDLRSELYNTLYTIGEEEEGKRRRERRGKGKEGKGRREREGGKGKEGYMKCISVQHMFSVCGEKR